MVNVPPLLCSTPPPIDFGEDDDDSGLQSTLNLDDGDEYSDFGLVTQTRRTELNTKVPSLPRLTPQPELNISDYRVQPPDLNNGLIVPSPPPLVAEKATTGNAQRTVEAFNFEVQSSHKARAALDYGDFQQVAPPTPPPLTADDNEIDDEIEENYDEEEEPNTNDNVPSLKLDSLSLYSSESVSASTLSPVADELATVELPPSLEKTTKAHILCHQVTLEDVSDDSDDECSPKKPKELFIREGAENFFAIEIVGTPTANKLSNGVPKQPSTPMKIDEPSGQLHLSTSDKPKASRSVFDETPPEDDKDEENDFGDFADFSAANLAAATPATMPTAVKATQQPGEINDDGFDDFQDFATAEATTAQSKANDDDDDDDFGDFSEPSFVAAAPLTIAVPPPPPPAAAQLSITERVKPVLELMFPTQCASAALEPAGQKPLMRAQALHFSAIEQANALDYQWNQSEMRHSLVRSLAIDSRNILFGDKWNSAMPRFAANLSVDPLKPLKAQTAAAAGTALDNPLVASVWQAASSSSAQTLEGLDAAAAQACEIETQPGASHGQNAASQHSLDDDEQQQQQHDSHNVTHIIDTVSSQSAAAIDDDCHCPGHIDTTATASAFVAATAAASLSIAVSADSDGYRFDGGEQQHQQQHLDLRASPLGTASGSGSQQQLDELVVSTGASYAVPLKETHIYTPSKSDTAVAKTTTLTPVDFDYEIAAAGIVIDETVVKKEYRDVEYKPPPFGLDTPSKLSGNGAVKPLPLPHAEDDDFSDFQSMPANSSSAQMKATAQQLQPPRNGTPTFGEQMILSPAVLLPQAIPLAKTSIEWGDSALASINADELARIEELFPQQLGVPQRAPQAPTISASVAQQQGGAAAEDDDWSDFVSVPVHHHQQQQQQQQHINNNNNLKKTPQRQLPTVAGTKDDDWSDFVSSTPPAASPQFNSGAWQSANFYSNPLSLYQQQQQPTHSNLVPKYQSYANNNNNNSSSNNNMLTQQIHIMHDFSTLPEATGGNMATTYQQQHHQHHQQRLQQQQRQQQQQQQHQPSSSQFQIGNAKVAPRISLIPDLSFVAPALPNNAGAFMSSLPKPSFSAKK